MTNCNANATNSIAKPTNSTTKLTNSIAKLTNSIANGTNSIAKLTNSIANGTNSIAKAMSSIAKTCNRLQYGFHLPVYIASNYSNTSGRQVHQTILNTHVRDLLLILIRESNSRQTI